MKKILGIDLGTNSLGWALVASENAIIDGGVIIFPRGNNVDAKNGKESSFSQQRTVYRGARRRLYRRKLRRRRLLDLAARYFNLSENAIFSDSSPLTLYRLRAEALHRNLSAGELFRVCLYFAKKRGFLSNRKEAMRETTKEQGVVLKGISELEKKMHEAGAPTLGAFYYQLICDHYAGKRLGERILERWTSRQMYKDELAAILDSQSRLGNPLLNESLAAELQKQVFYQRPLKSAKNLVARCRFETAKRCMPKSHPVFQEFRSWQIATNLTWTNPDTAEFGTLSLPQKQKLADFLHTEPKPTEAKVKSLLGLPKRTLFNDLELKCASTMCQMIALFEKNGVLNPGVEPLNAIYHSLLFTADDSLLKMQKYLKDKFGLPYELSEALWGIRLEQDYSNISHKAAQKILPWMRKGMRYDEACAQAGYHHSHEIKFRDLPEVRLMKTNELRNPVVQKAVSACIRLVNQVIRTYGKPDEVRIELARELKKPKKVRERIRLEQFQKQKKRELYQDVLLNNNYSRVQAMSDSLLKKYELWLELGCESDDWRDFDAFTKEVSKSDLEKYRLWLEADRVSPYTGKVISLSMLMSPEIEIEHILPFSRSLDNGFMNKTLSERSFNAAKGNLTPLEYYTGRPHEELEQFRKRIATFSNPAKRSIFLKESLPEDFANSQLSDTAYIATQAIGRISECIEKVYATKGGVTHIIRKSLGLNSILHYDGNAELISEMKNRGDHRHHFIDAMVIATTSTSMIQQISRASERGDGSLDAELRAPWNSFRSDVEEKANNLLIVHRFPKKLTKTSINRYKHDKRTSINPQLQRVPRGSMHEDTLYGKIVNPYTGNQNYVVRKPISGLDEKNIDKIVDGGIRNMLKSEIERQGSWTKVVKEPVFFNGKPLRRVRCINSSNELPLLREETQTFIEPGNNYILVIYQDDKGKRDYLSITFFDALRNRKATGSIYPAEHHGKKLLYSLTHYDKFILYKDHPEEIDWNKPQELNERLYHVIKFTGNSIYLGRSILSKIQADKDKMPIKYFSNTNTIKAVKVKLDLLGRICWRSDVGPIGGEPSKSV